MHFEKFIEYVILRLWRLGCRSGGRGKAMKDAYFYQMQWFLCRVHSRGGKACEEKGDCVVR